MTDQVAFRFRFSLKAMLLALLVCGVSVGLLGKLFFANFPMFLALTTSLVTVVPFLLAVGTLIRLGVKFRQPALLWWGVALLLIPVVGSGALIGLQQLAGPGDQGLGFLSNDQLIVQRIMQDGDSPQVWRELERRLRQGKLTNAEVDQALRQLVSFMDQKMPKGWDQPLSWQDDFVGDAFAADAVSDEVAILLCDRVFGGAPQLEPIDLKQGRQQVRVRVRYGSPWGDTIHSGVPINHLWTVRRVLVDGREVNVENPHLFAQYWRGTVAEELAAASQELVAEVEVAYVDADKLIGINNERDLPPERWPTPLKRWTTRVSIPLDGSGEEPPPPLQLVKDPGREPHGEVRVERLVAQQDEGGRQMIVLKLAFADGLTIPLSFDVLVRFGDANYPLGGSWAAPYQSSRGAGQMTGGQLLTSRGHLIDPVVEAAEVILRPNVEHLQNALQQNQDTKLRDAQEIWGQDIVFPEVTMERLDRELPVNQGAD